MGRVDPLKTEPEMEERRLTPYLRRRVLALPVEDRIALNHAISESLRPDAPDGTGDKRLEALRSEMEAIAGVDLLDRCRDREHTEPRIVFAFVCRREGFSQSEIARFLGVDHSTVCYWERRMGEAFAFPRPYSDLMEIYNQFVNNITQ